MNYRSLIRAALCLVFIGVTLAQQPAQPPAARGYDAAADPSGMYTFLKEGEFVQLTVDNGQLSGYISRFGDSDSDRGQFIDQFFDKATLQGDRLYFKTKTVHGVWYEFDGTLTTVSGKAPGQEGYRLMKGAVKRHVTDADKSETVSERKVELHSFPEDMSK